MRIEPACSEPGRSTQPKPRRAPAPAATPGARPGPPPRPEFPAARYFQVHFEHLEALLDDVRRCLDSLRQQIAAGRPAPEDAAADPDEGLTRALAALEPGLSLQLTGKRRKATRKALRRVNPELDKVLQPVD